MNELNVAHYNVPLKEYLFRAEMPLPGLPGGMPKEDRDRIVRAELTRRMMGEIEKRLRIETIFAYEADMSKVRASIFIISMDEVERLSSSAIHGEYMYPILSIKESLRHLWRAIKRSFTRK